MAVLGLPRAAESCLTTLLTDHSVTSWKLTGEGDSTVFILRLRPGHDTTGPPLSPVTFRRKPPCAIRRDRERAILRQQERGQPKGANAKADTTPAIDNSNGREKHTIDSDQEATVCKIIEASELLVTVPSPSTRHANDTITLSTHHTTHAPAEQETRGERSGSVAGNVGQPADLLAGPVFVNKPDSETLIDDNSVTTEDEMETEAKDTEQLAAEAGIKVSYVKNYARGQTNRRLIENLKDESRNSVFNKVVVDRRSGDEILTGESDDFVVRYDCQRNGLFVWYLKEARDSRIVVYDLEKCLRSWPAADAEKYGSDINKMMDKLDTLCCIFQDELN